jgi:hypothetical protein
MAMRKIGSIGDVDPVTYGGGYIFTAPQSVSQYDWVDWDDVARSTGQDAEDLTSPSELRTAQARALAIQDAAGFYGWHEFDQYPLELTLGELKKRWHVSK